MPSNFELTKKTNSNRIEVSKTNSKIYLKIYYNKFKSKFPLLHKLIENMKIIKLMKVILYMELHLIMI